MTEFHAIYIEAVAAGKKAAARTSPRPMMVGTAVDVLSNEIDYDKPVYYVPDGVCGFAWVSIRPRNSAFAKWLKANNLARSNDYEKAMVISIRDYGQSMELKEAHAVAMATVFEAHGIKATANSRID